MEDLTYVWTMKEIVSQVMKIRVYHLGAKREYLVPRIMTLFGWLVKMLFVPSNNKQGVPTDASMRGICQQL
jgi:hypothetical protein